MGKLIWNTLIPDPAQLLLHTNNTEVCTNTTLSDLHILFKGSFCVKLILKAFSSVPIYPVLFMFLYLLISFPLHLNE